MFKSWSQNSLRHLISDEDVEEESMLQFAWVHISSQTMVSSVGDKLGPV